jgi:hypothetical protein
VARHRNEQSRSPDDSERTVEVHGQDVRVGRPSGGLPHAEVRARFGGFDPLAVLAGFTAALGSLVVLGAVLGVAGVAGGGQVDRETLSIAGLVAGVVALGLSLLFGGYVAGRVARYSGLLNALVTAVLFVVVAAALSALAAREGVARYGLPEWLDRETATTAALVSGLVAVAVAVALLAGALGGRIGGRWHRQVDDTLLGTREGGLTPYPGETVVPEPGGYRDRKKAARR